MAEKKKKGQEKSVEQERVRRQKMEDLKAMGVDSFRIGVQRDPSFWRYSSDL
ncbi:hypothetical protein [Dubosiella newyorkensis]|uniref:hypothetical protein n=1 Tax=Dubosiella newyorkensis TaxID=1862672 RepID=UPI003F6630E5